MLTVPLLIGKVLCSPPPAYLEHSHKVGRVFGALSPPITVLMLPGYSFHPSFHSLNKALQHLLGPVLCQAPGRAFTTPGAPAAHWASPTWASSPVSLSAPTMFPDYPSLHSHLLILPLSSLSGWDYCYIIPFLI